MRILSSDAGVISSRWDPAGFSMSTKQTMAGHCETMCVVVLLGLRSTSMRWLGGQLRMLFRGLSSGLMSAGAGGCGR